MRGYTMWAAGLAALGLIAGGCAHRPAAARTTGAPTASTTQNTPNGPNPQMQRFQQKYPGTAALMRSVLGLRILLQSGKDPLTPDQARNLDGTLRPLLKSPTLPQDKAQQIAHAVSGNLTPDQQTDIGLMRRDFRGRRGMRPQASGANGQAGNHRMRWMNTDMPANANIFLSGPANRMLSGILNQLQGIEKS